MFNAMIETLKANPRKIVFTEGHDARILEATARLNEGGFLTPILIGNVDEVKANAAKGGFDIEGVEIIESEIGKLSYVEQQIYEMMLDRVPQKVIAATLNLSHSNVRKKWHDIRKKLLKNKYIFGKLRDMGLAC